MGQVQQKGQEPEAGAALCLAEALEGLGAGRTRSEMDFPILWPLTSDSRHGKKVLELGCARQLGLILIRSS